MSLSRALENISTTITNLACIVPCYFAYIKSDYLTMILTMFAALASGISHLFESHKHDMWGFGCDPKISLYLNYIDMIGSRILAIRIGYLVYLYPEYLFAQFSIKSALLASLFYVCMRISEHDYTARTKTRYLIFHNIWHLGIFSTLGYFLHNLYEHIH